MQLPQLLIVLLVAFASCNCCQYTLPNDGSSVLYDKNAKGEDVVQAVLSRIEEANIFDSDHYFMRRLAYVETEDGNKSRKLGIWAYDLHYQTTINNAINDHLVASNAGKRVCEEFGINVTEVHSIDVKKPLFSGVMARFYLFALNVTRNKSIPVTVPEQATFWNEEYNRRRKMHFKTPSYYLNRVLEKECKGCHNPSLCNWTSVCNDTGKGEKVVNDVLSFIEYTKIFDSDHQFMRRLAYVETRDGQNLRKHSSGQYGIWAYNFDYQTTVVNALRFAVSFSEKVFKRFGINVTEVDSRDVKKPLVSGVRARFYLFALNVTEKKSIPVTVPEQATFWHEEYNSRPRLNTSYFVNQVQELEGKGCPVKADIVFVIDLSYSISQDEFKNIREFQYKYVSKLNIGKNHMQVGTITFKGNATTVFDLNRYDNSYDILAAINHTTHDGYGGTNIKDALCSLKDAFSPQRGGRPPSSAVYRIAILMSDGKSTISHSNCSEWKNVREAADDVKNMLTPILIYTIGVGDDANEEELRAIATSESSYTHIDSFSECLLQNVQEQQSEDFCWRASVHKEWDEVLNASLGPHETFRYNLVIGFGIALNICIMKGQIDIYATIFIPNPSKVFNEWHLQLEESENDTVCKTLQMETGEDSEAARRRRRQLAASAYKNLYISVTGGAAENVFVVNTSTLVETDDTTPDNSTTNGPTDSHDSTEWDSVREREVVVEAAASSSAVTLLLVLMCCIIIATICAVYSYRKKKKKKGQETKNEDEYHLLTETNEDNEF